MTILEFKAEYCYFANKSAPETAFEDYFYIKKEGEKPVYDDNLRQSAYNRAAFDSNDIAPVTIFDIKKMHHLIHVRGAPFGGPGIKNSTSVRITRSFVQELYNITKLGILKRVVAKLF